MFDNCIHMQYQPVIIMLMVIFVSSSHDMKTNPYLEELSPNVSTSDVHSSLDVVVPVDGHQTIIG
jgi:hypothetical protein